MQNLDAMREVDILETRNMSKHDRQELLGSQFYTTLFERLGEVPKQVPAFRSRRGRQPPKSKSSHIDDDATEDGGENSDEESMAADVKTQTPVTKKRRKEEPSPNDSPATQTIVALPSAAATSKESTFPLLVVILGAGNGNSTVGCIRSALAHKRTHVLVLDPSATTTEFVRKRAAEIVYRAWFDKTLRYGCEPMQLQSPLSLDALTPFDPTPLSVSPGEGRLLIPEKLLIRFERRESTQAMVEEFKANHYDRFLKGHVCIASIREFLMGRSVKEGGSGGPGPATPVLKLQAPHDSDDPTTLEMLDNVSKRGSCVGMNGKVMLHATSGKPKLFLTVQADHGVLEGQRLWLFGGGKFKPLAEAEELQTKGKVLVHPNIQSDEDMILFQDNTQTPPTETYQTVYATISALIGQGKMKEPLIPFHHVTVEPSTTAQGRTRYTIVPTRERVWVSNRGFSTDGKMMSEDKPVITNIASLLGDVEGFPNKFAKARLALRTPAPKRNHHRHQAPAHASTRLMLRSLGSRSITRWVS